MTTLEDLDAYHDRLAHEFNRIAHNNFGWCVKSIGYESIFSKRKGAMKVIGRFFTPETLFLRSLPDYCLWGRNLTGKDLFHLIEVKGPAYISPYRNGRKRVRVEAYQALLLLHINNLTGMMTKYVFMNIDGSGVVCPVDKLPFEEICETETFRGPKWSDDLRARTREMTYPLQTFHSLKVSKVSDPQLGQGSGDPFLAFDYESLLSVAQPILEWFESQGPQRLSEKEHIGWEGKENHLQWRSFL
jgi:hypothetical protein